jgi:hypothetical protein
MSKKSYRILSQIWYNSLSKKGKEQWVAKFLGEDYLSTEILSHDDIYYVYLHVHAQKSDVIEVGDTIVCLDKSSGNFMQVWKTNDLNIPANHYKFIAQ